MYRDNSLVPSDAIRLAALGLLTDGPRRYADLAAEVRAVIQKLAGPSLDLLGPPLELLRFEGLVEPVEGSGDRALLAITPSGRSALETLLTAHIRPQVNDFNRLVVALKLRFIGLLTVEARRAQLERLEDLYRAEVARLTDLRRSPDGGEGLLGPWLDQEIAGAKARLDWCLTAQESI